MNTLESLMIVAQSLENREASEPILKSEDGTRTLYIAARINQGRPQSSFVVVDSTTDDNVFTGNIAEAIFHTCYGVNKAEAVN